MKGNRGFIRVKKNKKKALKDSKTAQNIKDKLTPRNMIIGAIAIFIILILSNVIKGILLLIIFFPMALYTVQLTRFVDGVTLETYTGSSIVMAYIYGPNIGLLCAFLLTAWSYFGNGIVKLRAYLQIMYNSVSTFITGYIAFTYTDLSFSTVFILSILINNGIAFVFNHLWFDPDKLSNIMYRITHSLLNLGIYRLIFQLFYDLFLLL